jgi:hypothetical protein
LTVLQTFAQPSPGRGARPSISFEMPRPKRSRRKRSGGAGDVSLSEMFSDRSCSDIALGMTAHEGGLIKRVGGGGCSGGDWMGGLAWPRGASNQGPLLVKRQCKGLIGARTSRATRHREACFKSSEGPSRAYFGSAIRQSSYWILLRLVGFLLIYVCRGGIDVMGVEALEMAISIDCDGQAPRTLFAPSMERFQSFHKVCARWLSSCSNG